MKTIPNAQTSLPSPKADGEFQTYADLLAACLDYSAQGFSPDLLRKRARVEKAIEGAKAGDEIKLEDADYVTAQDAVRSVVWVKRELAYLAFSEAFGV